ncbi:hypothetical protein AVEN_36247-1 [Araneus ventricosus]|uniref:Uncharacterized protein n=1 Tax=Araneus ventricosus TaxID=182803 RepID=A0A4Y2UZD8_ARAVE|nr:hypothetical protein AVEN_113000-1 [Araneus ventricosus]GBO17616.1 hypothetical protein AVEN_36247-1 [Araneus ventricosus]
MERLGKLFAEVETDEDPDFDDEDNRSEDILGENFSNHESFSEYDTESCLEDDPPINAQHFLDEAADWLKIMKFVAPELAQF